MLFDELSQSLSKQEAAAIAYLESIGYQVMTEARLDDCKKKDGKRVRTFSLSGRYDLIIGLKSIRGRAEPAKLAEEGEEVAAEEVEQDAAEVDEEIEQNADGGGIIGDNLWMDENRWKRMNREMFFTLVTEEALDDLFAAPIDVQDAVQAKFLKFFKPEEWPI